jgi:LmbE family N-acetylglucosaminyl deacetylase
MPDFYAHVYLSPHLDDAVLSCGGLIHQQAMADQRPLVITLFAGEPPRDAALSDFAQSVHARWEDQAELVPTRWAEDQAALATLRADYLRLSYPDCIYRGREHEGEWYYASEQAIFGEVHSAEGQLPAELATTLTTYIPPDEGVTLYAPLTVGNHVDHQLTFAAALILREQDWQVRFYEDYPYVETEGALAAALAARGAEHWQSAVTPLDDDDIAAKIRAITCYESQLGVLFDAAEAIPGRVRSYVDLVGGERLWLPDHVNT